MGQLYLAWEFAVQPDATRYVMENKQIEIDIDSEEVIIEVYGEGQDNQRIGQFNISINDLVEDHLVTEIG